VLAPPFPPFLLPPTCLPEPRKRSSGTVRISIPLASQKWALAPAHVSSALLLHVVTNAVTRGLGGPVSAWRAACSCRVPVATTTAACSIDARQQSRPLAPGTASFNRRPRPVGAEAGCIAVISLLQKVFWGNK